MHKFRCCRYGCGAVTLSILLPAAAMADPFDVTTLRIASLAATCNACHGVSTQTAGVPALTALSGVQIREALLAFRQGTREGTVMPQLAKGYRDAQIAQVAAFYDKHPGEIVR